MPSFDQASRNNNGSYWSGTAGILAIQLAILFALSVAAIIYVNWSSDAALAEFNRRERRFGGVPVATAHSEESAR